MSQPAERLLTPDEQRSLPVRTSIAGVLAVVLLAAAFLFLATGRETFVAIGIYTVLVGLGVRPETCQSLRRRLEVSRTDCRLSKALR